MRKAALTLVLAAALVAARVAPAFAAESLAPGATAPGFTLKNQDGKDVKLSDYKGKIIVLQWLDPECPFVQRHYEARTFVNLDNKWNERDVVHLAVYSGGSVDSAKRFHERQTLKFNVLADADGAVAKKYGAKTTPHMFVIGKDGKIVYTGAIDNDPDGNRKGDKVNYVDKALEEVTNGRPVSEPETKSYGCEVKTKT
jgi:peroxiredoxin